MITESTNQLLEEWSGFFSGSIDDSVNDLESGLKTKIEVTIQRNFDGDWFFTLDAEPVKNDDVIFTPSGSGSDDNFEMAWNSAVASLKMSLTPDSYPPPDRHSSFTECPRCNSTFAVT